MHFWCVSKEPSIFISVIKNINVSWENQFSFISWSEKRRRREIWGRLTGSFSAWRKVNMAVAVNRDTNNVSCCNEQLRLHPWLSLFQHIKWWSKKLWQHCNCFYNANEAIWIQLGFKTYATSCSQHQQGSINLQHLCYPCRVCLTQNWWLLAVLNMVWEIYCVPIGGRNFWWMQLAKKR